MGGLVDEYVGWLVSRSVFLRESLFVLFCVVLFCVVLFCFLQDPVSGMRITNSNGHCNNIVLLSLQFHTG